MTNLTPDMTQLTQILMSLTSNMMHIYQVFTQLTSKNVNFTEFQEKLTVNGTKKAALCGAATEKTYGRIAYAPLHTTRCMVCSILRRMLPGRMQYAPTRFR